MRVAFAKRQNKERAKTMRGETYEEFVGKFKAKLTTDDCVTPEEVYDVIYRYLGREYPETFTEEAVENGLVIDPFFPGGDYKNYDYPEGVLVVANPPFSCLAKIVDFYNEKGIKYFLFAPALTALQLCNRRDNVTCIITGAHVIYQNCARVATAFVANFDTLYRVRIDGVLGEEIKQANAQKRHPHALNGKLALPRNMLSSASLHGLAKHGFRYNMPKDETAVLSYVGGYKGWKVYGAGCLMSDAVADGLYRKDAVARALRDSAKEAEIRHVEFTASELALLEKLNSAGHLGDEAE